MQLSVLSGGNDVNEAAQAARSEAKFMASLLSYLANGPVSEPRLVLIHEVADDDAPREYHYFLADPLNLRSTTRVGTTAINDLVAKLEILDPAVRDRVERAMHWHAVALDLDDRLERVQAILTGFEALNPLLAKQLAVDPFEIRRCPSCGAESKAPVASGVHAWLRQECGEDHMRKTRDLRNGLLHGYRPMAELYPLAGAVLPALEPALMKAIAVCSDASDTYHLIPSAPLVPSLPFSMALHGTCLGPVEATYFANGALPEFAPRTQIKSSSYDPAEDRVTMVLEQTPSQSFHQGFPYRFPGRQTRATPVFASNQTQCSRSVGCRIAHCLALPSVETTSECLRVCSQACEYLSPDLTWNVMSQDRSY
jgi:hypothetical protein